MQKIHHSQPLTRKAGSNVREFGEESELVTQNSLLERSSALFILPHLKVAGVEIFTILEFAKAM
jgi:hypothetical protein